MIAVIGTGNMGTAIAEGLLSAGREVTVFNRTRDRTARLESLGARVADSAADALRSTEAAIVVLPDAGATREVLFEPATAAALEGARVLNVAHTTPAEIIELAEAVRGHGGRLSEVNVTVYPEPVRTRSGHFNVAADDEDVAYWTSIFTDLGKHVHFVGAVGNASRAEFALWLSYAFNPVAVAYSTAAFKALGLPHEALVSALTENPTLRVTGAETYIEQMVSSSYAQNTFSVDNFSHSVRLAIQDVRDLGLPPQPFEDILELFISASRRGHGADDVSAVVEAIASDSSTAD